MRDPAALAGPVAIQTGATLYVERHGSGPPVVLVHANFVSRKMWEPQIGPLADRFTVVTYDVRGFGSSSLAPGRHSDRADLRALIDALELDRPHLVGLSMGAGIVWDAALAYPGLARSLAVVPGGIDGNANPAWMDVMWPKIEAAVRVGDFHRATELVTDPDLPPLRSIREHPDVLRRLIAIVSDHPWAAWSSKWPAHDWLDPPAYGRMSELDVPVLAISGALDAPEFRAESEYIARTAPHAEHLEIANASHFVNMEAPAEFNEAVITFIERVESANGAAAKRRPRGPRGDVIHRAAGLFPGPVARLSLVRTLEGAHFPAIQNMRVPSAVHPVVEYTQHPLSTWR